MHYKARKDQRDIYRPNGARSTVRIERDVKLYWMPRMNATGISLANCVYVFLADGHDREKCAVEKAKPE